jgi:hypothetical protein
MMAPTWADEVFGTHKVGQSPRALDVTVGRDVDRGPPDLHRLV